ncbi:MAG: putative quinol monooxygenase [Bacteroidota bacterium]
MIIRIVRLHLREEKREEFHLIFSQNYSHIRQSPGCLHLELMQDSEDSCVLYTYSQWESPQHLEAYRKSAFFRSVWPRTKALFAGKAQAFSMQKLKKDT